MIILSGFDDSESGSTILSLGALRSSSEEPSLFAGVGGVEGDSRDSKLLRFFVVGVSCSASKVVEPDENVSARNGSMIR
jgi:hypothetical protein